MIWLRHHQPLSHHILSSTTLILVGNRFASLTMVGRVGTVFSVVHTPNNNYDVPCDSTITQQHATEQFLNSITNGLKDLNYVWRPLQLNQTQDFMDSNVRILTNQLKRSTSFIKYTTKTLDNMTENDETDVYYFTMLYNLLQPTDVVSIRNLEDEFEMDSFDERHKPAQWTSVISTTLPSNGQLLKRNSIMVLKAPDSLGQFTKESLVSILDIAEAIGCEKVIVAINRNMEPAAERLQIIKAFMYIGFKVQHPNVMSVDGHILLS